MFENIRCIDQIVKNKWALYQGDSIELIKGIPDESIDYMVFSPPFSEMYVYNNLNRDLGNSRDYEEFWNHFKYLLPELFRVLKSGRSVSIHCVDIPLLKEKNGVICLKDFPGDIVRNFENDGFLFHSRVTIWKDPLIETTRTHAIGLLYKQLCKDSAISRMGCADYIITLRKPGENRNPIEHNPDNGLGTYQGKKEFIPKQTGRKYNHRVWQLYASPVWMDIRQSHTLQGKFAKDEKDEKHICPLQLDTIHRCLMLWTNKKDIVLDPFNGIASTGYKCLELDRYYVGFELKQSYFEISVSNLESLDKNSKFNLF